MTHDALKNPTGDRIFYFRVNYADYWKEEMPSLKAWQNYLACGSCHQGWYLDSAARSGFSGERAALVFSVLTALSDCGLWIIVSHCDNAETQTQRYKEELDMLIDLWQDPALKALAQLSGGLGGWHTSKMAGKCWHLRFTDPLLNLSSVLTDVGEHAGKSRDCLHKNRWWTKVVLPLLLLWRWHIYIKHSEFFLPI